MNYQPLQEKFFNFIKQANNILIVSHQKPDGDTLGANFALAYFLVKFLKANTVFTFLLFSWAIVVSYSRIYLGVHYPGDAFAGCLAGGLLGIICSKVFQTVNKRQRATRGWIGCTALPGWPARKTAAETQRPATFQLPWSGPRARTPPWGRQNRRADNHLPF